MSAEVSLAKTYELNEAYAILGDESKRAEYDEKLRAYIKSYSQSNYNDENNNTMQFTQKSCDVNQNQNQDLQHGESNDLEASSHNSEGKKRWNNADYLIRFIFIVIWVVAILLNEGCQEIEIRNISNRGSSTSSSRDTSSSYNQSAPVLIPNVLYHTNKKPINTKTQTPVKVSNGQTFKNPSGDCPCKISIKTSSGSNYYVYMDDQKGNNDLSFYVVGGNTVTKDIPLGTYKLYYCTGDTWYGTTNKFGNDTVACTSDDLFVFASSVSGKYIYYDIWEVTLYKVPNGNMTTDVIDMTQFPD